MAVKAQRLHDLIKRRDRCFRNAVMADSAMSVMLSLFLAECKGVALTQGTLGLINLLDDGEEGGIIESLVHAGLAIATGEIPERRAVGLTPLGSARMRSFISDYPDI